MAVPTGTELEIYASPTKTSEVRVKVRLDIPLATTNFVDEFSGSSLDTALWSSIIPPNCSVIVSGGKLTLAGVDTNGFPMVWSMPGITFPSDLSIGWTMEWTMDYPSITGYGVFFRVCDLQNDAAIVAIKANTAQGFTVEMPDGTVRESLGINTSSHDFELIYTPPTNTAAGQYEIKRNGVSKGTMASTGRQAWYIAIGNSAIQTAIGTWTTISVNRVDVNLTSTESQTWPSWTDREQVGSEWWGRLPWLSRVSIGTHKRNQVDQAVLTLPMSGPVTGVQGDLLGPGYLSNAFAEFRWANREMRIEARQGDGHRWTSWKETFRGLCDEPQVRTENGRAALEITVRDKVRRRLQMYHAIRGYSDAADAIVGLTMNKTWTQIITDLCDMAGLASTDYNVLSNPLKPRTWQLLGEAALDGITELADQGAVAVYRNAGQTNPGRLEVQEWAWGSDSPDFWVSPDADVVSLDWDETVYGMAAQFLVTVQHSEFGEFADLYPRAPVPPFGAVIRANASIAQSAGDINSTRLLPYLQWRVANRGLQGVAVRIIGQDWLEHDLEAAVLDRRILGIHDEYYIVDGWDYEWTPDNGLLTTIYKVNQHPEKAVMRASLAESIQTRVGSQRSIILTADLNMSGKNTPQIFTITIGGTMSFSSTGTYV